MTEQSISYLVHVIGPIGLAFALGAMLGLEREMSHKPAGLRTQVLIAIGTTVFVLASRSMGDMEVGRVSANILTGLGFLGGGVILQQGGNVRGLTTAALIWVNGAIGLSCGLENYPLAISTAVLSVASLRILGAIERKMGHKCHVAQYEIRGEESESLMAIVQEQLDQSHFQDGPMGFARSEEGVSMRFAFCNSTIKHQKFTEVLRKNPAVKAVTVQ